MTCDIYMVLIYVCVFAFHYYLKKACENYKTERNTFGASLYYGLKQHDLEQIYVNFKGHRSTCVFGRFPALKANYKNPILDFLHLFMFVQKDKTDKRANLFWWNT